MRKTDLFLFRATALIGAVLLAGSFSAAGQSVERVGPDRISVNAEEVPLATLFSELSDIAPLEIVMLDPEVEQRRVTLKARGVPVRDAIVEILEAAGVNYTIWGGNGEPFRIFAGPPEKAVGNPAATRREDWDRETEVPSDSVSQAPAVRPVAPSQVEEVEEVPGTRGAPTPRVPAAGGVSIGGSPSEPPSGSTKSQVPGTREAPTPDVPGAGGASIGSSPSEEPQSPPSEPLRPPSRPRRATGSAIFATGSAVFHDQPGGAQLASTIALLGFGLLLGVTLVSGPRYERHSVRRTRRDTII